MEVSFFTNSLVSGRLSQELLLHRAVSLGFLVLRFAQTPSIPMSKSIPVSFSVQMTKATNSFLLCKTFTNPEPICNDSFSVYSHRRKIFSKVQKHYPHTEKVCG